MSILEDFYKRINSHLLYGVSTCSGSNCSPNACGALPGDFTFLFFWRSLRKIIVSSSLNVRIYHLNYLDLDFTFWEVLDSWFSLYLLYFKRFVEILCFILSQFSNWHASRNLFISCRLLICWCIVVHSIVKSPFFSC